jgi:hypothetical protein
MYEPEWLSWHCIEVDMHLWAFCKDWCYRTLGNVGENWNWSRFLSRSDVNGYTSLGPMGFYFKNEEDAIAFKLANKTTDYENI